MGLGWICTVLVSVCAVGTSWAGVKDPLCAGIIREVLPLGGRVEVEGVEAINTDAHEVLSKYTQTLKVQEQLQQPGTFAYLAIREGEIVGFVILEKRSRVVDIRSIAVAKENQRTGIGRDLMNRVFDDVKTMQGIEEVRVLVAITDTEAKDFFARVGLTEVETIRERFNARQTSGVLLKYLVPGRGTSTLSHSSQPQLQLAPAPKKRTFSVATAVLPATFEELLRMDPTLEHARDMD